MMPTKSYWQPVYIGSATAKSAVLSWFGLLAEGLEPYKAEILCDKATDREKKARVLALDANGGHFKLERTVGKNFTITRSAIAAPKAEAAS